MDRAPSPGSPLPLVAVAPRHGQLAVVAAQPLVAGQPVLRIEGPTTGRPTRYSVQVGPAEHVEAGASPEEPGGYPAWRFLNHSCAPNTRLAGRTLLAATAIGAGEELTFDYDTTEWDLAAPFPCACGSPGCRGLVRGYRHLSAVQRRQLGEVAPHLPAALARAAAGDALPRG